MSLPILIRLIFFYVAFIIVNRVQLSCGEIKNYLLTLLTYLLNSLKVNQNSRRRSPCSSGPCCRRCRRSSFDPSVLVSQHSCSLQCHKQTYLSLLGLKWSNEITTEFHCLKQFSSWTSSWIVTCVCQLHLNNSMLTYLYRCNVTYFFIHFHSSHLQEETQDTIFFLSAFPGNPSPLSR